MANDTFSPLEIIDVIAWYISVLNGDRQDLQKNNIYAAKLGKLIKNRLGQSSPYDISHLCDISNLSSTFAERCGGSIDLNAECELVGRGKLNPKYRHNISDIGAYGHAVWLKGSLHTFRKSKIPSEEIEKMAIYVYLIIHSMREVISNYPGTNKLFKITFEKDSRFQWASISSNPSIDELLRQEKYLTMMQQELVPVLKELRDLINKIRDDLTPKRPASFSLSTSVSDKKDVKEELEQAQFTMCRIG